MAGQSTLSQRKQVIKDTIKSLSDRVRNIENWMRHTRPSTESKRKEANTKRKTLTRLKKWLAGSRQRLRDMENNGRKAQLKKTGEGQ